MSVAGLLGRLKTVVRSFSRPAYRPECHYMRGPGPACMRRTAGGR